MACYIFHAYFARTENFPVNLVKHNFIPRVDSALSFWYGWILEKLFSTVFMALDYNKVSFN